MMKINLTLFILLGLFLVVALGVPTLKKRNPGESTAFQRSLDGEWTGYSDKFCASGAYITIIFANEGQDVSMAATAIVYSAIPPPFHTGLSLKHVPFSSTGMEYSVLR